MNIFNPIKNAGDAVIRWATQDRYGYYHKWFHMHVLAWCKTIVINPGTVPEDIRDADPFKKIISRCNASLSPKAREISEAIAEEGERTKPQAIDANLPQREYDAFRQDVEIAGQQAEREIEANEPQVRAAKAEENRVRKADGDNSPCRPYSRTALAMKKLSFMVVIESFLNFLVLGPYLGAELGAMLSLTISGWSLFAAWVISHGLRYAVNRPSLEMSPLQVNAVRVSLALLLCGTVVWIVLISHFRVSGDWAEAVSKLATPWSYDDVSGPVLLLISIIVLTVMLFTLISSRHSNVRLQEACGLVADAEAISQDIEDDYRAVVTDGRDEARSVIEAALAAASPIKTGAQQGFENIKGLEADYLEFKGEIVALHDDCGEQARIQVREFPNIPHQDWLDAPFAIQTEGDRKDIDVNEPSSARYQTLLGTLNSAVDALHKNASAILTKLDELERHALQRPFGRVCAVENQTNRETFPQVVTGEKIDPQSEPQTEPSPEAPTYPLPGGGDSDESPRPN